MSGIGTLRVKNNPIFKGLNIFKHEFFYTAYPDDTIFFLKDEKIYNKMSYTFSKLLRKPNKRKSETAGIVFRTGFKSHSVAWNVLILIMKLWKCLTFIFHLTKILTKKKKFYERIIKIYNYHIIKNILKRELTLEGRIRGFNLLAISKINIFY